MINYCYCNTRENHALKIKENYVTDSEDEANVLKRWLFLKLLVIPVISRHKTKVTEVIDDRNLLQLPGQKSFDKWNA